MSIHANKYQSLIAQNDIDLKELNSAVAGKNRAMMHMTSGDISRDKFETDNDWFKAINSALDDIGLNKRRMQQCEQVESKSREAALQFLMEHPDVDSVRYSAVGDIKALTKDAVVTIRLRIDGNIDVNVIRGPYSSVLKLGVIEVEKTNGENHE